MTGRKRKEGSIWNINNTWRVDQDKLNYILQHKGKDESSEDGSKWVTVGYYQTVAQLYNALVNKHIKEPSLINLKELNDKVNELHQLINNAGGIMNQSKIGVE